MDLLGERYELGDQLGRGGMAEVRQATDTRLNRQVAVKRLRTDLASDPTFQARFRREAQSAAGLNHPNIVAVYDTGEDFDERAGVAVPYIVMELVEGQTLRDVLRDGRKIMPERALEIMQGVLEALSYSHRAGIVHRDIKPANVMLTPNGTVKVMDFGIARAVADTSANMTQTAAVIGTAQYLSPEQARGETVDARSDLYSAGCLLYELLCGRPPFVGDSPVSVAYQHVREQPTPPSQLDPMITEAIDAVVLTSLAKDPGARYQTAREMSDDLGRLLSGQDLTTVLATPPPPYSPGPPTQATQVLGGPAPAPTPASAGTAAEADELEAVDGEGEPEEEEKRRRWPVVVAVLALLVIALGAAGLIYVFNNPGDEQAGPSPSATPQVEMVDLPRVIGFSQERAESELANIGLQMEVDEDRGADDATVGQVTEQNPNPDDEPQVEAGSTVTVTVNIGPDTATIPSDIIGQQQEDAVDALVDAGFDEGNIETREATEEVPNDEAGQVLTVDPDAGSEVAVDETITLTVATGQAEVPDWQGLNQAGVEREAQRNGFTDVRFEFEDSDEVAQGEVIRTEPSAGVRVPRDSEIVVVLATEAPPEDGGSDSPDPGDGPTPSATPSPSPSATPDDEDEGDSGSN